VIVIIIKRKYRYHFVLKNNITLRSECGDIKNFEFGKHVIFLISDDNVIYDGEKQVVCVTDPSLIGTG
jgi:hypothetical protein